MPAYDNITYEGIETDKFSRKIHMFILKYRNMIGLISLFVLTGISISFNYEYGMLSGSDEITRKLFPLGFAFLDVVAIFLSLTIAIISRSITRKFFAFSWMFFLVSLSVFSALSFTIASDARLASNGNETYIIAKKKALEQAEEQVAIATEKYNEKTAYKSARARELREARQVRDSLIDDVRKLQSANPHVSMAIYYRLSALLHDAFSFEISPDSLSMLVRMLWTFALVLSPFVLASLLGFEFAANSNFSPGENAGNTEKHSRKRAKKSKETQYKNEAQNMSNVVKLDQDAMKRVRTWLATQDSKRLKRSDLKLKAKLVGANQGRQLSMVIDELIKEGWIERMSNMQLRASRPEVRRAG
jgi:hypothetical protein